VRPGLESGDQLGGVTADAACRVGLHRTQQRRACPNDAVANFNKHVEGAQANLRFVVVLGDSTYHREGFVAIVLSQQRERRLAHPFRRVALCEPARVAGACLPAR
jgi:hypothetical protein